MDTQFNNFFASEAYYLYCFKILSCPLKASHDWSACPWAHPKEQARRRDPRRFYYLPVMCPFAKAVRTRWLDWSWQDRTVRGME
jgi:hypothetical protein